MGTRQHSIHYIHSIISCCSVQPLEKLVQVVTFYCLANIFFLFISLLLYLFLKQDLKQLIISMLVLFWESVGFKSVSSNSVVTILYHLHMPYLNCQIREHSHFNTLNNYTRYLSPYVFSKHGQFTMSSECFSTSLRLPFRR